MLLEKLAADAVERSAGFISLYFGEDVSEEEAQKAQNAAKALFVGGGDDANIPTTEITEDQLTEGKIGLLSLMVVCKLATSNGDARKNVAGGGVSVNDEKITDVKFEVTREMLKEGVKLRKGKKVFHKAILK